MTKKKQKQFFIRKMFCQLAQKKEKHYSFKNKQKNKDKK